LDPSTFIVAVFCLVDDRLKGWCLRRSRGPTPKLSDAEVLTIEVVGEFLGMDTRTSTFSSAGITTPAGSPPSARYTAPTFARQAANLLKAKERLWQEVLSLAPHDDPALAIVDSMPLPACLFARAYRSAGASASGGFRSDAHACR